MISAIASATTYTLDITQIIQLEWEWWPLVGFGIFFGLVTWIFFDLYGQVVKLRAGRPNMTLGNRAKAETVNYETTSEMDIKFRLLFRNSGTKNAHLLKYRTAIASPQEPSKCKALPDLTSANPVAPNTDLEFGRNLTIRQKYEKTPDGQLIFNAPIEWLIYSAVIYDDSPTGGKQYRDEWWFYYGYGSKDLQDATLEQKQIFEPYVRELFTSV